MQQESSHFSVGDRVRFVHGTKHEPADSMVIGEVAGINQGVATVDVVAVLDGRPTFVTKRPWDLQKVLTDGDTDDSGARRLAERRETPPSAAPINRS
jgi:hypothetical protein